MNSVIVAVLILDIHLPGSLSLKDKRMLIANLHVYECSDHHSSDDQDCTTCIVQKSTAEFLISYPDTAIAAQYPTDKSSLLTMGNVVEDVFALALSSRAPPLYFL